MSYTERALRTLSAGNRTLLRAVDESNLLQEMCRAIVEIGGYRMAWVGRPEQNAEKTISPLAHSGFENGFLDLAHFSWADSDENDGPTSQAVRTGKPVIIQNINTLSGTALQIPIKESLKRGYAAVAAFPLIIDGKVIGNLTIFAAEPDAFDEQETELLGEMADDLAFGIAMLRIRVRHREAEETIRRMAYFDALTGLPNRTSLQEKLDAAIDQARQQHQPLAVLLVKIGRFQEISDTLGYQEGNALLVEMAARLQNILPAQFIARVGEDEFAFILTGVSAEAATQTARQITRNICQPVHLAELDIDAHAFVGMALFPGHGSTAEELMRRAKIAAAQARQNIGNYAIYKGAADQESRRRLALMSDLRRAINGNELQLYCQPKAGIASGTICGAEALVRWTHPQHGAINTSQFVALAERAGLMMPLTRWVLEAAFQQSHSWHEMGIDCPLAVNLSAQDLHDPQRSERIAGRFATWAMPPRLIQFELTESTLMEDPGGALETMFRLKELGVELFIDDFGTGYSSLSYLQKLPVSSLKIDQSFVGSMLANTSSAVIVRSTIELGHNLGLGVVAEGVETQALWNSLEQLGCDTAQGYFVSRPVPAEGFATWLGNSPWRADRAGLA